MPKGTAHPRARTPRQERSRGTVEVLLQATTRVLTRHGYEACTTNRVAQEAGVSIGSLYQYFSNKEALVLAVMERHQDRLKSAMAARLLDLSGADLPTAVREMVRAMLEAQLIQPRLHRVLVEQVPRVGILKRLHDRASEYEPMIEAWLRSHTALHEVKDPAVAAYVLIGAVEGVLGRVLVERPTWLEMGLLHEQITRLVLAYLSPSWETRR